MARAPPAPASHDTRKAPWLVDETTKSVSTDVQARLWSSEIPAKLELKCLVLWYSIFMEPPRPFYVWRFDEDLCEWTNSESNWRQKWRIDKSAVCLHARRKAGSEFQSSWLSGKFQHSPNSASVDIQARLWSPLIPSAIGIRCITFEYSLQFFQTPAFLSSLSLALLQRKEGCQVLFF
uniref:MAM domain-containing protein n=1 Tax=Mesocestoides corti TaxID=53468 RepID=A0A5K3EXX0_MESCO